MSKPFDLRNVDPRGRLDVLAANAIDQLTACVPEMAPVIEERREAVHMRLNELLGPHALPGVDTFVEDVRPFVPAVERIVQEFQKKIRQANLGGEAA